MLLHIALEDREDGFFLASVPALPGCHTQGLTRDEVANSNARVAPTSGTPPQLAALYSLALRRMKQRRVLYVSSQ